MRLVNYPQELAIPETPLILLTLWSVNISSRVFEEAICDRRLFLNYSLIWGPIRRLACRVRWVVCVCRHEKELPRPFYFKIVQVNLHIYMLYRLILAGALTWLTLLRVENLSSLDLYPTPYEQRFLTRIHLQSREIFPPGDLYQPRSQQINRK
jgi:uncharacterized membrane protein YbaN (DUF454 family)